MFKINMLATAMLCISAFAAISQPCDDIPNRFIDHVFETSGLTETDINYTVETMDTNDFGNPVDRGSFTLYSPTMWLNPVSNQLIEDPCDDRPLIILIHGGGFAGGTNANMQDEARHFARLGYVVAAINYRLAVDPKKVTKCDFCNTAPMADKGWYFALQDLHAALSHLVENAALYDINPDQIFIGGNSAGAIAAVTYAVADQANIDAYFPDGQTLPTGTSGGGLIGIWGDLEERVTTSNPLSSMSYTILGTIGIAGGMASPQFIDANDTLPNMLLFHGSCDPTVPIDALMCPPDSQNQTIAGLGSGGVVWRNGLMGNPFPIEFHIFDFWTHGLYGGFCDGFNPAGISPNEIYIMLEIGTFMVQRMNGTPHTNSVINFLSPNFQTNGWVPIAYFCKPCGNIKDCTNLPQSTSKWEGTAPAYSERIASWAYPNPASNQLSVNISSESAESRDITVLDVMGKVILSRSVSLSEGKNQVVLDVNSIPDGTYFIRIENAAAGEVLPVTISH